MSVRAGEHADECACMYLNKWVANYCSIVVLDTVGVRSCVCVCVVRDAVIQHQLEG